MIFQIFLKVVSGIIMYGLGSSYILNLLIELIFFVVPYRYKFYCKYFTEFMSFDAPIDFVKARSHKYSILIF